MLRSILATVAFAALAVAQTTTDCNPLNRTCADDAALGTTFSAQFNKSMLELDKNIWNVTAGTSLISFGSDGLAMGIYKSGDSVSFKSTFHILFGRVEVHFRAANGTGIISTAILLSDDLDEIDWEIKGTNTTHISTNWYGQYNKDVYQSNGLDPAFANAQSDFHNYTLDWTQDRLIWYIDGTAVRTINSAGPGHYPQTPSFLSIGMWAGGDASQPKGTQEWAGGQTDYSQGPFIMNVKSISVTDSHLNTSSYTYGDRTGSWQSIKVNSGESKAYQYINKPTTTQSAVNGWNTLSTGAKIGIACGIAGALAIGLIAWCAFCCVQRRKGREEKRIADKEWDEHQNELMRYRRMQQKGGFAVSNMTASGNKF